MDPAAWGGLVAVLAVHFIARLAPMWPQREQGCDAYFFLLCAEAFRGRPRLPIVLPPLYLLEPQEQWYPPFFPVLLALLPPSWLRRRHWLLSHALDACITVGIYVWLEDRVGIPLAAAAALIYGTEANLVAEYRSLTPRALAVILVMAFLFASAEAEMNPWWLIPAALSVVALTYTHKLSVQLLWFAAPALSAIRGEYAWVIAMALGYVCAFGVAPGLFWKMQRAHFDILRFWNRNWRWLGAHQIRASPIYGTPGYTDGFHGSKGLSLIRLHLKRLILGNPWFVPALVTLTVLSHLSPAGVLLLEIIAVFVGWALLTLLVPALRSLGEGTKYVKYSMPLCLMVVALGLNTPTWWWVAIACIPVLGLHVYHYWRVWVGLRDGFNPIGVMTDDLRAMLREIGGLPQPRLLCLPTQIADLVAYNARRPVLWGTHGYGFRRVEAFFPVLRKSIREFTDDHRLTHALLDRRYVAPEELGLLHDANHAIAHGNFILVPLADGVGAAAPPRTKGSI